MTDKLVFRLNFVFDKNEEAKAIKLHRLVSKYGAITNIGIIRDDVARREDRLKAILNCMKSGREYTTGSLWRSYAKHSSTGYKTFQRDVNSMVVLGFIKGRVGKAPKGFGRTCYWTRLDIYVDKYNWGVKDV